MKLSETIPLKKPITNLQLCTKNQIAALLGVSEETVRKWYELDEDPLPSSGTGMGRRFDWHVTVAWYERYKKYRYKTQKASRKAEENSDSSIPGMEELEREHKFFQKEKEKIRVEELLRTSVPIDYAAALISTIIAHARQDLQSMPNRLKGEHGLAVHDAVKKEVDGNLKNLATRLGDLDYASIMGIAIEEDDEV
jgi:predicted transcriptional regulator